jgi:hypothetical protein
LARPDRQRGQGGQHAKDVKETFNNRQIKKPNLGAAIKSSLRQGYAKIHYYVNVDYGVFYNYFIHWPFSERIVEF